jgi:hypothetical protein
VAVGVSPEGLLAFPEVAVGSYTVTFAVPGFQAPQRPVVVGIAEVLDVGDIPLGIASLGAVEGTARLAGAPPEGHQGIFVEARGSPFATLTTSDGHFRLEAAEGTYDLRFTFPGYGLESVPAVAVVAGRTIQVEPAVTLSGAPGRIRGAVALQPGFEDPERLAAARVELAGPDGAVLESVPPGADGRFVFDGRPAGEYGLAVVLEGFGASPLRVLLPVGGDVDVGVMLLFADMDPSNPATASGVALLFGAPADGNADIRVEARGTPFSTTTGAEGLFRLELPPGAYTLLFSFPGYSSDTRDVQLVRGEDTAVDGPVVLTGQPGLARGVVSFAPAFAGLAPLTEVSLSLFAGDGGEAVREDHPDPDGGFRFEALPAGPYRLVASHPLFFPEPRRFTVPVGGVVEVPPIELSTRPDTGLLFGRAQVRGAAADAHGGTSVELLGTRTAATTTSAGDWSLVVPAGGEAMLRLAFRRPGYTLVERETPQPGRALLVLGEGHQRPATKKVPRRKKESA